MSERTQRKRQPLALRLASEIEASRGRLHKACLACQERLSARRVHNLRAESRRLQLRIELSAAVRGAPVANKAVRRVRTLFHAVGPLRDTQVQLKGLNAALRPVPGLISLRKFLELRERRLAKKALMRIRPTRLDRCLRKFRARLSSGQIPAGSDLEPERRARQALADARRQAVQAALQAGAGTEGLHRTRIALKRYRLIREVLAQVRCGALGRDPSWLIRDLAVLGEVHDLDVFLSRAKRCARDRIIAPGPAKLLHQRLTARRAQLLQSRRRTLARYRLQA